MTGFRYELVKKSIAGYPKFHASDFEFSLPQPTYTINTLRTLEASYPDREFYFIMGADNWKYITRWVEYEPSFQLSDLHLSAQGSMLKFRHNILT